MATRFAMANNDSRYYLNGMLFETDHGILRMIATDGHRLAVNEYTNPLFPLEPSVHVIVPRKAVMELLSLLNDTADLVEIQIDDNTLKITSNCHEFITKLIEGRFPDYKRVLPPPATLEIGLDRDTLKQGLLRAATLSNEKNRGVRLLLGSDLLRIVANNPEQEEAEAALHLSYQGAPFEIGFNASYLLDILSTLPAGNVHVKLIDPSCSVVICGEPQPGLSHFHVVMPLRL
jgi:DNA polymerase-3 subunit beta